jgi:glycosyltransferase involved in cell wall biosynthesis
LKGLAESLGIGDVTRFLGDVDDMPAAYNAMDALCLTSRQEALPNALLEAMAVGLPCAATDVGDVRTALEGIVEPLPAGDHEAVARAVVDALSRRDLGPQLRRRVAERYSEAVMVQATEAALARFDVVADPPTLTLLYVVSRWGEPTQTFVRREVAAALAAGHRVVAVSLKAPRPTDPEVQVVHLGPGAVAAGAVATSVRHPARAASAVWRAARQSRLRTLAPNLAASLVGLAAHRRVPPVDWVQAHFNWVAGTAADALSSVRAQPFGVFPHAFDIFDRRYVDRYTGDKLRRAALVLVESEEIRREVTARFRCEPLVQRMGIPSTDLVASPSTRPGALVVSVGSLSPKKGHDDLLRALARVPGATLRILGEGPERASLVELAGRLGVADRVELVGAVPAPDVRRHLDAATAFCLASKPTPDGDRDGLPNVLIEAMGRGTPVISTTVAGIPELLGADRGRLVAPGDVEALASAIAETIADPETARARAQAALAHVRKAYTTDVNWRVLEDRIRSARRSA